MRKIASVILAALIIITSVSFTKIDAAYSGYSVQGTGNSKSAMGKYVPSGYTPLFHNCYNSNYNFYMTMSYKTQLLNETTARVYIYTAAYVDKENIYLAMAATYGIVLNGVDMTPNSLSAGSYSGSNIYGIIINSNSYGDSTPSNKNLGAYYTGDAEHPGSDYPYWRVLYSFDVPVGSTDTAVKMSLYRIGSGALNYGSTCSSYNLALDRPQPHSHSYGDWTVEKSATCTEAGSRYRTCSCGDRQTEAIPATGHNMKWVTVKEATTSETGLKEYRCSTCGYVEKTETIPVVHSHSFGEWKRVEPTCDKDGYQTRTCTSCGQEEKKTINKLGHNMKTSVTKEATCNTTGTKTSKCSRCGYETTETIPALSHSITFKTVKKATCEEDGLREGTCSRCGTKKTETVEKLGHNYIWIVEKQATETEDGLKAYKCTRCSKVSKTELIEKGTSFEPEPYVPEVEEVDISKLIDEAIGKVKAYAETLPEDEFTSKNWKKVGSLVEESEQAIKEAEDEERINELADEYIERINQIERRRKIVLDHEDIVLGKKIIALSMVWVLLVIIAVMEIRNTRKYREIINSHRK